jgi:hypothetical protein
MNEQCGYHALNPAKIPDKRWLPVQ